MNDPCDVRIRVNLYAWDDRFSDEGLRGVALY
jgi:hypothetical protein